MRAEDKARVVEEVIRRVWTEKIEDAQKGKTPLHTVINDTVYHERNRLSAEKKSKTVRQSKQYWKRVNKELLSASEEKQKEILKELVTLFTKEIVGNFNDNVYKFATGVLPVGLSVLLNTISPRVLISHFPRLPDISDRVIIRGEVEQIKALHKKGTVILVPTHSSNMDSIVVGWALHKIGLPPFAYGAGLNLFSNRIISYFMNNLGAYKVDRKKWNKVYKDTLKEYATVALENGYHNLFFPGGGRSRSGAVEQKLKLGLMGTGISAYINNLKNNKEKPNLYVVPCTLSYQLVLEGENLSEDFLKETGKSRYIIENDEFSQVRRILNFLTSTLRIDSRIYVHFCPAVDLFGNRVDNDGISYDNRGRKVDTTRYVLVNGEVDHLHQRDCQYTRNLGKKLSQAYLKYNVIMSTNIVAFVIFKMMKLNNPGLDLYSLIRTGEEEWTFSVDEVLLALDKLMNQLWSLEKNDKLLMDERLSGASTQDVLDRGLRHLKVYHRKPALLRKGEAIIANEPKLVMFYHNRLLHYGLEIE